VREPGRKKKEKLAVESNFEMYLCGGASRSEVGGAQTKAGGEDKSEGQWRQGKSKRFRIERK